MNRLIVVQALLAATACGPAHALIGGEAVTLHQSELDGYLSASGGCSGVMLTNEWVFTAAHCYKTQSDWKIRVGGNDNPLEIPVDNAQSLAVPNPQKPGETVDIRIMKLKSPAVVNGMTTGYVQRSLPSTSLPADLLNKDVSKQNVLMELGSGGTEDRFGDMRRCRETAYRGTFGSPMTLRFDHDNYAGHFPIPDPDGTGCEYVGGDSGSATLYRSDATGEWFVLGGCPGWAEGTCIAADVWQGFVQQTIWGADAPAGLSVPSPRVKSGEAVEIAYSDAVKAGEELELRVEPAECADPARAACSKTIHAATLPGAEGAASFVAPADARGRYQVRLYRKSADGRWSLRRVVGLHVGASLVLEDADYRQFNYADLKLFGLADGQTVWLYLIKASENPVGKAMRTLSAADIAAIRNRAVGWKVTELDSSTARPAYTPFVMSLFQSLVVPDTPFEILLVDDADSRLLDVASFRTQRQQTWTPLPEGFDLDTGWSFYFDGRVFQDRPALIELSNGSAVAKVKAIPRGTNAPLRYSVSPEDLRAAGVDVGEWRIVRFDRETWVPVAPGAGVTLTTVPVDVTRDGKPATSVLATRLSATLSGRSVAVDLETTWKDPPPPDPKAARQPVPGIAFSAWTGLPGFYLGETVCNLDKEARRSCVTPPRIDLSTVKDLPACVTVRAQLLDDINRVEPFDPMRRASWVGHLPRIVATKTVCGF